MAFAVQMPDIITKTKECQTVTFLLFLITKTKPPFCPLAAKNADAQLLCVTAFAKNATMKRTFLFTALAFFSLNVFAQENPAAPVTAPATETPAAAEDSKKSKKAEEVIPPMFDLIAAGDLTAVEELIRDSVDYYRHNQDGETMLTLAIKNDDVEMVKLLVEDAVINMKNEAGETPLTLAIKQKNPTIITLVARRAKAGLKNDAGFSPLYLAIENNDLYLMRHLVEHGADVNRYNNGMTPISRAVELNNIKAIAFLVRNGAAVSQANENGEIPLYLAVKNGFDTAAGILLTKSEDAYSDANRQTKIGETLVNIAAAHGHAQVVKMLTEAGAAVDLPDHLENTALNVAAANGYTDIVRYLLMQDANIDHRNLKGMTPILCAAKNGQHVTVEFLAENGASINIPDYTGARVADFVEVNTDETEEDMPILGSKAEVTTGLAID